jgi:RimJ/RimL family protein N-acetyltransferase
VAKQNFGVKMTNIPTLETDRLLLKEVALAHIADYEKYFIDYEVVQHLSGAVPWPYPENGIESFIKNVIVPQQGKDKWVWGIFLKTNPDELIGVVDLWRDGKPENRGFWLGRKFWGNGFMTEATEKVTEYAFTELGFEKLTFSNAVGNLRSRRVKEKTGAVLIGVEPAEFVRKDYKEHEIWELTKDAWEQSLNE